MSTARVVSPIRAAGELTVAHRSRVARTWVNRVAEPKDVLTSPSLALVARAALAVLLATACSRSAPDATPEGAVRVWLDRMEESDDDPRAIREAYGLLGPTAHANLEERAARASRLEGHRVEPWEMLAEGRFGLKFRPKVMVAKIDGETASVAVTGDEPLTEHALVRCARARGAAVAWRVEPDLPPVPPLPQREPDPARPKDEGR